MEYSPLNHKEEQVMKILWSLEQAFVQEIIEKLPLPHPPYNTISSIVRKLEKLGHIGHEKFGKTYRYYPILKKETYRKKSLKNMILDYFEGSPEKLLSYFIKEEKLNPEELKNLIEKIEE